MEKELPLPAESYDPAALSVEKKRIIEMDRMFIWNTTVTKKHRLRVNGISCFEWIEFSQLAGHMAVPD